jgi:hypothetical protein
MEFLEILATFCVKSTSASSPCRICGFACRFVLENSYLIRRPRFSAPDALTMQTPLEEETWANQIGFLPDLSDFSFPDMGFEGAGAG